MALQFLCDFDQDASVAALRSLLAELSGEQSVGAPAPSVRNPSSANPHVATSCPEQGSQLNAGSRPAPATSGTKPSAAIGLAVDPNIGLVPIPSPPLVALPVAAGGRGGDVQRNRPPSPNYAAQRRLGGVSSLPPSRPGSAPIGTPPPAPTAGAGLSYVDRWMKNLYARRQPQSRAHANASGGRGAPESHTRTGGQLEGVNLERAATDVLGDRTNAEPNDRPGKTQMNGSKHPQTRQPDQNSLRQPPLPVPTSVAYRPPRAESASRIRSESSGASDRSGVFAPSGYVLPGRRARHYQAISETRNVAVVL